MNTYLQNVVRRGAGLPLPSTAAPRPSHGFERSVGTTELHEIATEQTAQHRTEDASSFQVAATSEFSPIVNRAKQPRPQGQQLPIAPSLITPDDKSPSSARNTITLASEHAEPPRTIAKSFESQPIETVAKVRAVESTQIRSEPPTNQEPTSQPNERPKVLAKAVGEAVPSSGGISIAVQTIRPADAERPTALQFPKIVSPQLPAEPVPIHVRVGRVEVRGAPTQTSARSTPVTQAPLGFVRYHRMRRYRN